MRCDAVPWLLMHAATLNTLAILSKPESTCANFWCNSESTSVKQDELKNHNSHDLTVSMDLALCKFSPSNNTHLKERDHRIHNLKDVTHLRSTIHTSENVCSFILEHCLTSNLNGSSHIWQPNQEANRTDALKYRHGHKWYCLGLHQDPC